MQEKFFGIINTLTGGRLILQSTRAADLLNETWYFSDRASWIDYTLITNLKHWLLFIH